MSYLDIHKSDFNAKYVKNRRKIQVKQIRLHSICSALYFFASFYAGYCLASGISQIRKYEKHHLFGARALVIFDKKRCGLLHLASGLIGFCMTYLFPVRTLPDGSNQSLRNIEIAK